jgi:hypothetical protein
LFLDVSWSPFWSTSAIQHWILAIAGSSRRQLTGDDAPSDAEARACHSRFESPRLQTAVATSVSEHPGLPCVNLLAPVYSSRSIHAASAAQLPKCRFIAKLVWLQYCVRVTNQKQKHTSNQGDLERRLAIPRQLLSISSKLTVALIGATIALYTFAPVPDPGGDSAIALNHDQMIFGFLVVSAAFFAATLFSLGWCLYESIPADQCCRLWGFSWRTSVPGSGAMLVFSAALCSLLLLPTLLILPRIRTLGWSWGPFALHEPQLARLAISTFFCLVFWLSIQEVVEPFLLRKPSIPGILYLLLLVAVLASSVIVLAIPWRVLFGCAVVLFGIAVAVGWRRIARDRRYET